MARIRGSGRSTLPSFGILHLWRSLGSSGPLPENVNSPEDGAISASMLVRSTLQIALFLLSIFGAPWATILQLSAELLSNGAQPLAEWTIRQGYARAAGKSPKIPVLGGRSRTPLSTLVFGRMAGSLA